MASDLFMVFGKDDNVERKLTEMRKGLNHMSAEDLKNLGNSCLKL